MIAAKRIRNHYTLTPEADRMLRQLATENGRSASGQIEAMTRETFATSAAARVEPAKKTKGRRSAAVKKASAEG